MGDTGTGQASDSEIGAPEETAFWEQAISYARDLSAAFLAERKRARELATALGELRASYEYTLHALARALDARDVDTSGHSQRVVAYTLVLGKAVGLGDERMEAARLGALLHDVGKIGVPDSILRKPAKLTLAEWKVMQKHPAIGHQILCGVPFLQEAAIVVLHHHERYDGAGYPQGLAGQAIHPGARVFAVADTLDAITRDRPYRRQTTLAEARQEILRHSGTQFDPAVVAMLADEATYRQLATICDEAARAEPAAS